MSQLAAYLARKAQSLQDRQNDWAAEPERAVLTLHASARVAGITGARPVQMGEHSILTDSAPGLAGHALGPTAPELLLGALASCLVHTYLIQATLMQLELDDVQVRVSGTLDMAGVVGVAGADVGPLEPISYVADVEGNFSAEQLEALHEAVARTCPVLLTLQRPVALARATGA